MNAAPTLAAPVAMTDAASARAAVKGETAPAATGGTTHRFLFPDGSRVEFTDRPKRPRDAARRERVVSYIGTESAAREPDATFETAGRSAGLSPEAIQALRFISRHEGGFDAINTWDGARFSWGFIQFAGGHGLRPALLHLKERSPELFRSLLGGYGIDVVRDELGLPTPVYLDPKTGRELRGPEAEQAFGDDPLAIALFIRAGRVPEVKERQVEVAVRNYVTPALEARCEGVRLSEVLRSPQGLATLIDRNVQEGNVARLEWALLHTRAVQNLPTVADCAAFEGEILDRAIRDAGARARIAELAETAAASLEQAEASSPWMAPLKAALDEANYRMAVGDRRDVMILGFSALLEVLAPERLAALPAADRPTALQRSAGDVRSLVARFRYESGIRGRLRDIRSSNLPGPPPSALVAGETGNEAAASK